METFSKIIAVTLNPAIDRVIEVPGFHTGGHQRGKRRARYPAGKAVNVARTMAMLGQTCTATGLVGQPELPWYRNYLAQQSSAPSATSAEPLIDCRFVGVAGHTRENISIIDPQTTGSDTHLVEQGFAVRPEELSELREVLSPLARQGCLVAFCGSLPEGLTTSHFEKLLELCLDGGASVMVDSSGEALRAAAQFPLWLVKPNREELAELVGQSIDSPAQQHSAARKLAQTIRWVLVSNGSEGAMLVDEQQSWRAKAEIAPEDVVGTVGCGDALVGGFLAGWQQADREGDSGGDSDQPPLAALRRGVATACFAATQLSRNVDFAEVAALEERVALSPITAEESR